MGPLREVKVLERTFLGNFNPIPYADAFEIRLSKSCRRVDGRHDFKDATVEIGIRQYRTPPIRDIWTGSTTVCLVPLNLALPCKRVERVVAGRDKDIGIT